MTQDEIRRYLGRHGAVRVQVATEGDGSPAIAWGDTFFYAPGADGAPKKMPFATIVTKDYTGFDTASQLDRGGLYRLNIEVGKEKFEALFGFPPKALDAHRDAFAFTAIDRLFPHPLYGAHGWISVINPADGTGHAVPALLDFALERALARST